LRRTGDHGPGGGVKVVMLRHGECLGNVDELAYTRIPDHALPLTARGEEQAAAAGPRIKELVGDARLGVYVSPYRRTLHTLALLGLSPAWTVQEPRLREQDWGNLQDAEEQRRQREERDFFGHFFYRLDSGESGADVDDRLAAFLTELRIAPPDPDVLLVVTHGLAMRLLARRALGWSVPLFEALSNPATCEERVLTLEDGRWRLDRPFAQWRTADDGTTQ
jgi:broad specificity phosphatase PhoE